METFYNILEYTNYSFYLHFYVTETSCKKFDDDIFLNLTLKQISC